MADVIDLLEDDELSSPAGNTKASASTEPETLFSKDCQLPATKRQRTAVWSLPRLRSHPVTIREGTGPERPLPDAELPWNAPATLVRNALPPDLADALLAQLLSESAEKWRPASWVVYGQAHETPRSSGSYQLRKKEGEVMEASDTDNLRDVLTASAELLTAAQYIESLVAGLRPGSKWSPTFALGNRYSSGQDCVGWHSDFLGELGPRPVIVGLSLGSRRSFRLRRVNSEASCVVTIPAPHNSVIVMWDDCQESWSHSVPRLADASIGRHPVAGLVRLSLTFRMARPELDALRKHCRCGRLCALKCKDGQYYSACNPAGTTVSCGFWEPCLWAQQEADRLRQRMLPVTGANADLVVLDE